MIATAACKRFLSLAGGAARSATVHSVFEHAVNLELEGREGLVGLVAEPKALTPYAVSVRTELPFFEAGVRAGMAAVIESGRIVIPQAGFELDCSKADAVDLSLDSIQILPASSARRAQAETLLAVLMEADADESLAPLATKVGENHYTSFLSPRFHALQDAVRAEDETAAIDAAERFAGCGMGLTPSSDDLLCGYLAAKRLLAREQEHAQQTHLLSAVAVAAAQKTNRISASFLLYCGEGLVHRSILELFSGIFRNADEAQMRAANRRVLAIGSTSGADMLTGVALALQE